MKYVFLCAIFGFEIGCLICVLAPNSAALIVGRAVQGAGAAGILLGCYTIPNFIVPPSRVRMVVGMIGTVFSVATFIASPIMAKYGYYQPYLIGGAVITGFRVV